jgi:hypothetical protein
VNRESQFGAQAPRRQANQTSARRAGSGAYVGALPLNKEVSSRGESSEVSRRQARQRAGCESFVGAKAPGRQASQTSARRAGSGACVGALPLNKEVSSRGESSEVSRRRVRQRASREPQIGAKALRRQASQTSARSVGLGDTRAKTSCTVRGAPGGQRKLPGREQADHRLKLELRADSSARRIGG